MLYFDTSYLFRIFSEESGHEAVKHLLNETECVCSALHGRAEFISVIQRKVREGQLGGEALTALVQQFQQDCKEDLIRFLPLTEAVMSRLERTLLRADAKKIVIRATDALHLACAAENGFSVIYSNDRHLLTSAPLFGMQGINIIS